MDASIVTAIITSSAAIAVAALTFLLTKRHEMAVAWREKKLDHYKQLLSALSDLAIDGKNGDGAAIRFSSAANTIVLIAPQDVIKALMDFA